MSLLFPCCRNALLLPRPQRRLEYNNVSTPIDADNQSLSLTSPLDAILCKQESVRNICGERNGEAKRKIAITIIRPEEDLMIGRWSSCVASVVIYVRNQTQRKRDEMTVFGSRAELLIASGESVESLPVLMWPIGTCTKSCRREVSQPATANTTTRSRCIKRILSTPDIQPMQNNKQTIRD